MFSSLDTQYQPYLASPSFPEYGQHQQGSSTSQLMNSIEFTDLTQVHTDDSTRRRRRSTTAQDKEAATNMRIVSPAPPDRSPDSDIKTNQSLLQRRRAQNRASQRAFRERKEKHVQHLENELETLESKHTSLEKSYSECEGSRAQLQRECNELREELARLRGAGGSSGWGSRESSVGAQPQRQQSQNRYKGTDQGAPQIFDPFSTDFFA